MPLKGIELSAGGGGGGGGPTTSPWSTVLANGNTSGANNAVMSGTQFLGWGTGGIFTSLYDGALLLINCATSPGGRGGINLSQTGDVYTNISGLENATNATTPWPFLQTVNGTPTAAPAVLKTGQAAVAVDRAAGKFWAYYGGAWNSLGGGTISLQSAYNGGNTIATAASTPVAISDSNADATAALTVTMGATTSGNGVTIGNTAGATGALLQINQTTASVSNGQAMLFLHGPPNAGILNGANSMRYSMIDWDTTANAVGVGGGILFVADFAGGGSNDNAAAVRPSVENTSDHSAALLFFTHSSANGNANLKQNLAITGAGQINIGGLAPSGGTRGVVTWNTGLGAINHILGPTDGPLTIASNSTGNQNLALNPYQHLIITSTIGAVQFAAGTLLGKYNGIQTAGNGIPAIYADGRSAAQTGAVGTVTSYTVGAADGSFEVSANVLVTASGTHSFAVTCAYTDESNAARTLSLTFSQITGTLLTAITNVTGAGAYEGVVLRIRCKAATTITVATTGTFTSVTYNVEAGLKQVS